MKRMMQFRFHGLNSKENYPLWTDWQKNNWFTNLFFNYGSVSHLGIQGEPGVRFYLNGGTNPITIGATGIYELNLEGIGRITSLRFDQDQLPTIYNNSASDKKRLIVDIVYDGPEVQL